MSRVGNPQSVAPGTANSTQVPAPSSQPNHNAPRPLSIQDAEQLAFQNNPQEAAHGLSDLKEIPASHGWLARVDDAWFGKQHHSRRVAEIDHYESQREIHVCVNPPTEDLGKVASAIEDILADTTFPRGVRRNHGLILIGLS